MAETEAETRSNAVLVLQGVVFSDDHGRIFVRWTRVRSPFYNPARWFVCEIVRNVPV